MNKKYLEHAVFTGYPRYSLNSVFFNIYNNLSLLDFDPLETGSSKNIGTNNTYILCKIKENLIYFNLAIILLYRSLL